MSAREAVLGKIRKALDDGAGEDARRRSAESRLARPPVGLVPATGQSEGRQRVTQFCHKAEAVAATVARVRKADSVPRAVTHYLRSKNLAPSVRMGNDRRLKAIDWAAQKSLEVKRGRAAPEDEVGVSYAFAGVAETGTVALLSGRDNPTTINFLPANHIVVVDAKDIAGSMETVISRLRRKFGRGEMPRLLNLITGPSRSGDIEQTILLGAHGPRRLHLIVVDG